MKQLGLLAPVPDTATPNAVQAKPNPVKAEHDRRNSNAQRILDRLKQGPALNWELCTPEIGGLRACGARIPELRAEGWEIEATRLKGGTWRYTLKGMKTV